MRRLLIALVVLLGVLGLYLSWRQPASLSAAGVKSIEAAIDQAIAEKKLCGAVLLVGHRGKVIFRRAFGQRALEPKPEPMTVDTIFDVASLTKLVATASSVMVLVERGQIQLSDPIGKYLPEIEDPIARRVRLERLLTHTSGYPAQLDLSRPWKGREGALAELARQPVSQGPEAQFQYSDINYIALGFIVERVSKQSLADFSRDNLFIPLGIERTTTFCPPADLAPIAPTQWRGGVMLRGSVHGAQAERMGGVAGNGGLFSRADDLARYCQMILNSGQWRGRSILGPATLARMTAPVVVSSSGATRGLGWDIDSSLATSRGEFFPRGSFGHTGYAGVSLWIDPSSQTYVIFMSNMVHPHGKGDVKSLRARLFSIVASSLSDVDIPSWNAWEESYASRVNAGLSVFKEKQPLADPPPAPPVPRSLVRNGIDVWQEHHFSDLKGRKVGVISDPSARSREGIATFDLLRKAPGVKLVRLVTGPNQLAGLDRLVFDLPDGSTSFDAAYQKLVAALEWAASARLPITVLDRPNLFGGELVAGPVSDGAEGPALPTLHGMTLAELARMCNAELKMGADLQVVPMDSWQRSLTFDQTQQAWVNPGPDIRNLNASLLYPSLSLLESTNLSLGIGTDSPYEWFGAPWMDGLQLSEFLNSQQIPGVIFVAGQQRPDRSLYRGQICNGCHILVVDRSRVRNLRLGLEVGSALRRLYRKEWTWQGPPNSDPVTARILGGRAPSQMEQSWQSPLEQFRQRRRPFLLYP